MRSTSNFTSLLLGVSLAAALTLLASSCGGQRGPDDFPTASHADLQIGDGLVGLVDPSSGVVVAVLFAHSRHGYSNRREEWLFASNPPSGFGEFGDFGNYVAVSIADVPTFSATDHDSQDPPHSLDDLAEYAGKCIGHVAGANPPYTCSTRPPEISYTDCTQTGSPTDAWQITFKVSGPNLLPGSWDLGWTTTGMHGRAYDLDDSLGLQGLAVMRYRESSGEVEYFAIRPKGADYDFPFNMTGFCYEDHVHTPLWTKGRNYIRNHVTGGGNPELEGNQRFFHTTNGEVSTCSNNNGSWGC